MIYDITTKEQLQEAARTIAESIAAAPFVVLLLEGELGAGKTTFCQTLAPMLGMTEEVLSPTYSLLRSYSLPDGRALHHLDLYRIHDRHEIDVAGISDLFHHGRGVFLVEWPRFLEDLLPGAKVLRCTLKLEADGRRLLTLT